LALLVVSAAVAAGIFGVTRIKLPRSSTKAIAPAPASVTTVASPSVAAGLPGTACGPEVETRAGQPTVVHAAFETAHFSIVICRTGGGDLYYRGVDKANAARWIVLPATGAAGSYEARNGSTRYQVGDSRLVAKTGDSVEVDEVVLSARS
jgi:hypothetical protein